MNDAGPSSEANPAPGISREHRAGLWIVAALVIFSLAAIAVILANDSRALTYTLYFDDARGLNKGDKVMLSGVTVGAVQSIKLTSQPTRIDVTVRISPEFADKIRRDSTAKIRDISWPNVSGQMIVEIMNPPDARPSPPMDKGATAPGLNGAGDEIKWRLKNKLGSMPEMISQARDAWASKSQELVKNLGQSAVDLKEKYEAVKNDPRVQAAFQALLAFVQEMKEKGIDGARALKAKWPEIKKTVGPAVEKLKEFGADRLIAQIRRMTEDIERTLDLWENLLEKRDGGSPAPAVNDAQTSAPTQN